jgi:hypothetical protein
MTAAEQTQISSITHGKHRATMWTIALSLLLLLLLGCAAKRPASSPVKVIRYQHCHEVSVDAKTKEVTLICPEAK